ncbi:unnamed protein product [Moneuplotes crassus]|uniref:Lipoprotein n=1 Tax=Euplotes crassus TaxID=5936 RepID=A0AAD1UJ98_EUPCR|nr:unnamed protein product [Moneuplotes crassus]
MKIKFLVLATLFALAACEIGDSWMEDASVPADVSDFKSKHDGEDYILFFHDISNNNKRDEGFFQSMFNIFGSNNNLDEEYQLILSDKYPTLEIDSGIDSLRNVPDDYGVKELPYIIAYHKNKEIWRAKPSQDTTDIIANKIRQFDNGEKVSTIPNDSNQQNQRRAPPPGSATTQVQRGNQQQRQQVQYQQRQQRQQTQDQQKQRIQEQKRQQAEYNQRQRDQQNRRNRRNGEVKDDTYVDPFDKNKHYRLDDGIQDDSNYRNGRGNNDSTVTTIRDRFYDAGDYVFEPNTYVAAEPVAYAVEPAAHATVNRGPARENLAYGRINQNYAANQGQYWNGDSVYYAVGQERKPFELAEPEGAFGDE